LKGAPLGQVEVRVVGGEIPEENKSLHVSHQPEPRLGEEAVIFIHADPRKWSSVVADLQGYLRVVRVGPERQLEDGFGRPIHGVGSDGRFVTRGTKRLTADELAGRIKKLAGK
jgi:hypothetical protein